MSKTEVRNLNQTSSEIFHSNNALWWGPDGTKLAYAAFNDTQVDVMTYPWYGSYEDSTNVYPQTIRLRYPKVRCNK
ncbi:dipeptidyl peptidase 4 [Caerostris extrusa]|uniref:Dipeptidyl peptidase 4 n=1 Tax=Caerostris extrusa TaxID=172846 RepID=A0AAV4P4Q8_CAEEX|nr:dipeptidyl peptidase 4 [Caerostris extrusa]